MIESAITNCIPRIDWFGLTTGSMLFLVGSVLTLTWVGAAVGIPMLVASIGLFSRSETLLGTPGAP